MKRILFLLFSLFFISTSQSFSQDEKKGSKEKRKMERAIKKEKEREQKLIEEENKKYGGEKKEREESKYTPTYSVAAVTVTDSIYMLKGKGGNIGLFVGKDGAFMVDDQFAEGTDEVLKKVARLTDKPVEFLINTHHHGDHTGGNKNLLEQGVVIFAHENVRKRLIQIANKKVQDSLEKIYVKNLEKFSGEGDNDEKAIAGAKRVASSMEGKIKLENNLPIITFEDDLTFHYNDEKILVFHVHKAHTDGDSMVYFTNSNVIHTGDVFFNGRYPYIDIQNGGTYNGYMNALKKIIMLADDDTKIIPGHGDVANLKDVKYTVSMLEHLYSTVAFHFISRKSKEQILAMKDITKAFDDKGYGSGYVTTDKFMNLIYEEVARKYRGKQVKEGTKGKEQTIVKEVPEDKQ